MTRTTAIVASLVLVGATLTAPCAVAGEDTFVLRLTGFREVPKTLSVDGSGTAKLTVQGSAILYQLTYQALGSAVTAAHIHLGENATAGGIAAFLCGGGSKPVCPSPGGSVSGIVAASDVLALPDQGLPAGAIGELIRALRAGAIYVNVHTAEFPTGEIRGDARRRISDLAGGVVDKRVIGEAIDELIGE
jgi:hypothetical protein